MRASYVLGLMVFLSCRPSGTSEDKNPCGAETGTLADCARSKGVKVGTATYLTYFEQEVAGQRHDQALLKHFNGLVPESELKLLWTQKDYQKPDYSQADALVAFAEKHDLYLRGVPLVWKESNPDWVSDGTLSKDQLEEALRLHVRETVKRYCGRIAVFDAVNEAFEKDGSFNEKWSNPWVRLGFEPAPAGLSGNIPRYVMIVFREARATLDSEACRNKPPMKLFYNDFDAEGLNAKSDGVLALAKALKNDPSVRLDGVGFQAHFDLRVFSTPAKVDQLLADMKANMARLKAEGLEVQITEMDVAIPLDEKREVSSEFVELQGRLYEGAVRACFAESAGACTALFVWGVADHLSWITLPRFPGEVRSHGSPMLLDAQYQPKPAYYRALAALRALPDPAQ